MANETGIIPTEHCVLVRPKQIEEKTAGGVFIPDKAKEKTNYAQTEGELIAVSPLAFTYGDWPDGARIPTVGDRVMFNRYQGSEVTGRNGEKVWLMKDQAIHAIMEA